ncbi:MAG: hypothetical protein WCK03_02005 [Candidatus Taylorbacteria bacterium]
MNKSCYKKNKKNGGYTLLFAMLTAALVLGVAVFILSVSRGQYILSATARESSLAVYASDSGIECGSLAIRSTILSTTTAGDNSAGTVRCGSNAIGITASTYSMPGNYPNLINGTAYTATVSFPLGNGSDNTSCAVLTIIKGISSVGNPDPVTIIESRGYNICSIIIPKEPEADNPLTVERALVLSHVGQE